jgi:hypothetical protein
VSLDALLGWEEANANVRMITETAALLAEFGRDEGEKEDIFNQYVVLLSEVRQRAKALVEVLGQLEDKTKFFANRAESARQRVLSSKPPSEAQAVVLHAAAGKGGHLKSRPKR